MILRSRTSSLRSLRRLYGTTQVNSLGISDHDPTWPGWQVIIGIEAHAQIKTREKLFSRECWTARTGGRSRSHIVFSLTETWTPDLASTPNSRVSPYDAAFPGTLPVGDLSPGSCTAAEVEGCHFIASQSCMRNARSQNCHRTSIRHSTTVDV
jgi:hypothetical protein